MLLPATDICLVAHNARLVKKQRMRRVWISSKRVRSAHLGAASDGNLPWFLSGSFWALHRCLHSAEGVEKPVHQRSCRHHEQTVVCRGTHTHRVRKAYVRASKQQVKHRAAKLDWEGTRDSNTYLRSNAEILNISRAEWREPSVP